MSKLRSKENSLKSNNFPSLLKHDLFDIIHSQIEPRKVLDSEWLNWFKTIQYTLRIVFVFGQGWV